MLMVMVNDYVRVMVKVYGYELGVMVRVMVMVSGYGDGYC